MKHRKHKADQPAAICRTLSVTKFFNPNPFPLPLTNSTRLATTTTKLVPHMDDIDFDEREIVDEGKYDAPVDNHVRRRKTSGHVRPGQSPSPGNLSRLQ